MTSDLSLDDWARLLDQLDEPPVGVVAEALADARDVEVGAAYDAVEAGLEAGDLVEEDTSAYGFVRLADTDDGAPERYLADEGDSRPLDVFDTRGYAFNPGDQTEDIVRARDAALTLLASARLGPPFATHHEEADGEWYLPALRTASDAVEHAIVLALLAGSNTETNPHSGDLSDEPTNLSGEDLSDEQINEGDHHGTAETAETSKPGANEGRRGGSPDDDPEGRDAETDLEHDLGGVATPSGDEFYPETLVSNDWWVNWVLAYRHDDDERDGKPTKQPVAPYDNGHSRPVSWHFGLSDEEHPCTTIDRVLPWEGMKTGIDLGAPERVVSDELGNGIILPRDQARTDERTIVLIDWDDVRDPETEEIHPVVEEALAEAGGYAEISQSGEGIHQFLYGEVPGSGKQFIRHIDTEPFVGDDLPAVEMYQSGRLCAMTGRHVEATGDDVVEGQDTIDRLCWEFGTANNNSPGTPTDPFASERDGGDTSEPDTGASADVPDHDAVARAVDQATEYDGPDLEALREEVPERCSLDYYAVVRAFHGGYAGAAYWQLEGTAAVLGERDGLSPEAIIADLLEGEDDSADWADETRRQVEYVHRRAEDGSARAARSRETLVEWGVLPEEVLDDGDDEEYRTDPREVSATVDVRRAWDAAGRVTPEEVDGLEAAPDAPERFATPSGDAVDVVRAVAIAEGLVDDADAALDDQYPEAYALAREEYGAPLPEYYTTADAIAEFDAVLDVIGEATYWDLDTDALATTETARDDDVGGDAVRALNPAWRESDSEASVLVFESGTVWDADTERVLDVVRFAALDAGIVDDPSDELAGEDFTAAYAAARDRGAPLPRWEPASDGNRSVTAQLPPAEELLDVRDVDGVDPDAIDQARADVEALLEEVAADAETPSVVTALPATGKTTGTIKTADERPTTYLAPRKELQAQALDKADRWGVSARILPVFSEERVVDEVLANAKDHVRQFGKDRLRDRWSVVANAVGDVEDVEAGDIFVEEDDDEDDVDLDRPTCPTADGEHGPAWALAVHVARSLGYTPQEIHTQARGLFGAELPCTEEGTCPYADGWEAARDPDAPTDLLVGSYVHAHVESARTYFTRNARDGVDTTPRALVLDEFPGEAFVREFDEIADDHATWLARSLREDVEDRRDAYQADLAGDDWVAAWLRGEGDQLESVDDALASIGRTGDLLEARDAAGEILDEVDRELLAVLDVLDPLETARDGDAREAYRALAAAVDAVDPEQPGAGLLGWVRPAVLEPLEGATRSGAAEPSVEGVDTEALPVAGDLEALVGDALEAACEGAEGARERLTAAAVALRGGERGCRRLAAWADDGYAHPDAHHLLAAIAAPSSGAGAPTRIQTSTWAFDETATEGTSLDVVDTGDKATTVLDRNGHGALLHTPPSRVAAGGGDVPLVGLDATGRAELWSVALGEDVETRDIHDTARERARFLEDALDLRVIQAADRPRYYEGSPASKDTDGDASLLETLADEYAGIDAPRERGAAPTRVGRPAAITTKGVREVLEADDRLDDVVSAWDNYGNVTGSNELGEHRLAAILGCQHFGDDAVERFAALAGESVDTDRTAGRGDTLGYGSELGDAYLAHMTEDQTTQAILRFARGDSGATVVARTSALGDDLPVVGDAQVLKTWSDTATTIAREYRRLGREFTTADVRDVVDVSDRHVRRVLAELADAGYVRRVDAGAGRATTYERVDDPTAGEVSLPEREEAVSAGDPGHDSTNEYYTWNVRVRGGDEAVTPADTTPSTVGTRAPPAPASVDGLEPPS